MTTRLYMRCETCRMTYAQDQIQQQPIANGPVVVVCGLERGGSLYPEGTKPRCRWVPIGAKTSAATAGEASCGSPSAGSYDGGDGSCGGDGGD